MCIYHPPKDEDICHLTAILRGGTAIRLNHMKMRLTESLSSGCLMRGNMHAYPETPWRQRIAHYNAELSTVLRRSA